VGHDRETVRAQEVEGGESLAVVCGKPKTSQSSTPSKSRNNSRLDHVTPAAVAKRCPQ